MEQARRGHMSDEYKKTDILLLYCGSPHLGSYQTTQDHHSDSQRTDQCVQTDKHKSPEHIA